MSSEAKTQNDAPADDSDDKPSQAPEKIINPRPLTLIIMLVVFLLGVGVILWAWHLGPFNTPLQQTENSYVKGNITLLSAQINGYIEKVYVTDFEDVKQGQPLVKVSSANYSQQVVQAESGLEQATTNLANQQQIIEQRKADVKAAQAKVAQVKTQLALSIQQLKRLESLVGVGAVSQNEVDTAKAAVKNNEALMSQAIASVDVAREGQKTAEVAKIGLVAQIKSANAQLNQANTNQEYGLITAPTSGKLGQINIRTGQLVTQGTQLVYLIPKSMWVIANFKETQIDKMKIGQKAWFTVDALGKQKFTGVVKSISPATGSEFSVIKTDNATGNFTKVVQRGEYNSSRWLANLVRILIMGLVVAMGLRAMGIADSIVNLAFGLTLGSVAVAFALAFGLGGRQPAERVLTDLIDKAKCEANQPNPLHKTETATSSASSVMTPIVTEQPQASVSDVTTTPEAATDHAVPDTLKVDPEHPPVNNPFGSTGEAEPDVDEHPKNDPK